MLVDTMLSHSSLCKLWLSNLYVWVYTPVCIKLMSLSFAPRFSRSITVDSVTSLNYIHSTRRQHYLLHTAPLSAQKSSTSALEMSQVISVSCSKPAFIIPISRLSFPQDRILLGPRLAPHLFLLFSAGRTQFQLPQITQLLGPLCRAVAWARTSAYAWVRVMWGRSKCLNTTIVSVSVPPSDARITPAFASAPPKHSQKPPETFLAFTRALLYHVPTHLQNCLVLPRPSYPCCYCTRLWTNGEHPLWHGIRFLLTFCSLCWPSPHRRPGTTPASVVVVARVPMINLLSHCLSISWTKKPTAIRYGGSFPMTLFRHGHDVFFADGSNIKRWHHDWCTDRWHLHCLWPGRPGWVW